MKKHLSILIVLLFALPGWAATYYVSTSGTAKGATACATFLAMAANIATPAKTVADMNTCQASLSDGDIIAFKRGDTWAEQLINAHANITFTGYGEASSPPPKFIGAGSYSARSDYVGQTFKNLWFSGGAMYFQGASNTTIAYNLITDVIGAVNGAIIWTGTTANIFNNTIEARQPAIYVAGASANAIITNNLILGGAVTARQINRVSGACTASNNAFFGGSAYPTTVSISNCSTDGGNNIGMAWTNNVGTTDSTVLPIASYRYPTPRVAIIRDDRDQVDVFLADIAVAQSRGITGYKQTLSDFAYSLGTHTAGQITSLRSAIDAGHEVALHSSTGSAIGQPAPYTAFTLTTTNGGTNTVTIDGGSAKTLTLTSTGNPENNISVDWSADRKSVCDLKSAMGQATCTSLAYTGKGWTITPDSNVSASLGLSSLADQTCSSFPCVVTLDKGTATNRFLYDEIVAGKTILETILDRPITSFIFHQVTDSAATTYVKESGLYKGMRSTGGATDTPYLNSINIWTVYGIPSQAFANTSSTDEATVRANTRTIYGWARHGGGVIATYFHGTNYITSEQVGWIADEFNKLGVVFVTFSELVDWIKADHDTEDGYTYTKSYPNTSDYHLRSGSPAINAGVDVGLTTDADGKPIIGLPDIGAYEYQPTGIPAGLFIGRRHKHMIQ